jgi:hypothetical protein
MKQADLFRDHEQPELFAPPKQVTTVTPEKIRAKLLLTLGQLKSADEIPWDYTRTRYWQTVFPQMVNWLPKEEAAQLVIEFNTEMARLQAA